ncbi:MAG TPA: RdgB/HAM1 family non-canonical purine NTP pyrophosphatase [Anaerolineae bacterium]|nr:RdgB/HAM1 family non-canonical purine NTP pyrophosphatase [Anaerolineae bacterium]
MQELLLATNNQGKIKEFRALLEGLDLRLHTPKILGLRVEVVESGDSYASNAELKAKAFSVASGIWCLADDSGLEVDVLEGLPGLHSARLIGSQRSDKERRQHLLSLLEPHPRPWTARFRSVVALASPGGEIELAEGECLGEVIPEERGTGGFGYDPIFLLQERDQTMAELAMEEKNRLSHRAQSIRAILPVLRHQLGLNA